MRARIVLAGIVVLALAVGAVVILRGNGPADANAVPESTVTQAERAPTMVVVTPARRADFVTRVTATGTVSALRETSLTARMPGRVTTVLVDEGDRVTAGQPLFRLDGSELFAAESQARAGVMGARARLAQLVAGARPEERRQAADAVMQAEAGVRAARIRLELLQRGARSQERFQAANAVAQARAGLDLAQVDVERMRSLYSQGAVARQQLDAAETQLRLARAAYDSARQQQSLVNEGPRIEEIQAAEAQLAQARAARDAAGQTLRLVEIGPRSEEIDSARAQLASAQAFLAASQVRVRDITVTAPFAGTIVRRMIEPGESVSPGSPAFRGVVLAQLDEVNVELAVPERHRAALQLGQQASVQVDSVPGRTFAGTIAEISPGATSTSRAFIVKVRVPNRSNPLRPGMFARGTISTGSRQGVLQIPAGALLTTPSGSIVFVVQDGRAVRRTVTIGDRQNGLVEIRSGIGPGAQVIVEGHEGLTDNQAVTPRMTRQ